MQNKKIRFITKTALIAALYAALTLLMAPISFGVLQFRVSEVLTVLPMFTLSAVPGLTIGCLLANFIGSGHWIDIVFGTLATLLAAVCSYLLRKHKWLVPLPPVIFNALIVGTYLYFLFPSNFTLLFSIGSIGFTEIAITYILGIPLIKILDKQGRRIQLTD